MPTNIQIVVGFFKETLGQEIMTLNMSNAQAARISIKDLDGFVVAAAGQGLLVEVNIDDETRPYGFGDYVALRAKLDVDAADVPHGVKRDDKEQEVITNFTVESDPFGQFGGGPETEGGQA